MVARRTRKTTAPTRDIHRLEAGAAAAIVQGRHGDPFAVLGMHGESPPVVRTFQPAASAVAVIDAANGERLAELERQHPDGLFVGAMAGRAGRFAYRLELVQGERRTEIEDPYRFPPVLGELDVHLLAEGTHLRIYEKLGAHPRELDGVAGTAFAVWAPSASRVSVVGDFNDWDGRRHPMRKRVECGVWELFLPGVGPGATYKYEILGPRGELLPLKADPVAFRAEHPPQNASIVHGLCRHGWSARRRRRWMRRSRSTSAISAPGRACPRRATATSPIPSWPSGSCPTSRSWASPISS
jgi:1,4-alpha-glucan branching enzyme